MERYAIALTRKGSAMQVWDSGYTYDEAFSICLDHGFKMEIDGHIYDCWIMPTQTVWYCRCWTKKMFTGWTSYIERCSGEADATRTGEIFISLTKDDELREYEVYSQEVL